MSDKITIGDKVRTAPLIFGGKVVKVFDDENGIPWVSFEDDDGTDFIYMADELEIVEDE